MKYTRRLGLDSGCKTIAMATLVVGLLLSITGSALAAATLRPTKVMDVLEFEYGVEIGSKAYIDTYGSNETTARNSALSVGTNMDKRYLRGCGIKHIMGTLIIRKDAATDPLRATVTKGDVSSLNAFRNYWNSHASEVGTSHDLAVYHVKYAPSGMAWVNSVGGNNRYALTCGNGATSWADGTVVHEFGHSWNLPHVTNQEHLYESKPRNNSGSHAAGGSDVYVSVMHGGGSHNIGRLASWEADRAYATRQNKRSYGRLITNPGPIAPFGKVDNYTCGTSAIYLDVIANDYDCNNDVLDAQLLDTRSQAGAVISLSSGSGPGGRNRIKYTPVANFSGKDFFHYTVVDSTGRKDWGCVYVTYAGVTVDTSLTAYNYDLGTSSSPVQSGWTRIAPNTSGDIYWSGSVNSTDRSSVSGVNNINRDLCYSSAARTLQVKVANGSWHVTMNMGDASYAHDDMVVKAEGVTKQTNIDSAVQSFPYCIFDATVSDGSLSIELSDAGGSDPNWVWTRLSLTRNPDPVTDAPIGQTIALKAQANNKYVCADNKDGVNRTLLANRTAVGGWEKFAVKDAGGGFIYLVAGANNKNVKADSGLNANRPLAANSTSVGDAEKYTWIKNSDNTISLKSKVNGKYVCADKGIDGTNVPLVANRTAIGGWERFTWEQK